MYGMDTELLAFLRKIETHSVDECWPFVGSDNGQGYGRFCFKKKRESAHRTAYRLFVGPIPEGFVVHHTCRNRRCCNPAHLELVTPKEHVFLDLTGAYLNSIKTHCKRGHEFTPENTRLSRGQRLCRICLAYLKKQRRNPDAIRNSLKTHCVNGHPFDEENTAIRPGGERTCRACSRAAVRRCYSKKHPTPRKVGRPKGVNLKTHCPNGHALEGDNLITDGLSRRCRICRTAAQKTRREAKRLALLSIEQVNW
jgi:hypothetical protein